MISTDLERSERISPDLRSFIKFWWNKWRSWKIWVDLWGSIEKCHEQCEHRLVLKSCSPYVFGLARSAPSKSKKRCLSVRRHQESEGLYLWSLEKMNRWNIWKRFERHLKKIWNTFVKDLKSIQSREGFLVYIFELEIY